MVAVGICSAHRFSILRIFAIITLIASTFGARITLAPKELLRMIIGNDYGVSCQVEDIENDVTEQQQIRWTKIVDGKEIEIPRTGRVNAWSVPRKPVTYLNVQNAKKEDEGDYKCSYGTESASISLSAFRGVSFGDTPTKQHPHSGYDAVITCRVDADPPAIISWYKDSILLAAAEEDDRYSVNDKGDLTIKAFDPSKDNGIYDCFANHATGQTATLHINVTGYVPPGPVSIVLADEEKWTKGVHEGASNVRLTCTASGVPSPTLKWIRNGAELAAGDNYELPEKGVLEIKTVTPDDAGAYRCEAVNDIGQNTTDFIINVFLKPRISEFNAENQTVMVGEDFAEECQYTGVDVTSAVWSFTASEYAPVDIASGDPSNDDTENENAKFVTMTDSVVQLHMRASTLEDAGVYTCTVTNEAGTASKSFNLQVQKPPEIRSHTPGNVRGVTGSQYTLFCEAAGVPPPSLTWSKKGGSALSNEEGHIEIVADGLNTSLKVTTHSDDDFGTYVCKASNGVLEDKEVEMEVIKIELPTALAISCDAEAAKPTSITLNGENASRPENVRPTKVNIVVTSNTGDENFPISSHEFDFLASNGVYKITKLQPEQQYSFNVTGENEAGISAATFVECSTTEPRAPEQPVFTTTERVIHCVTITCPLEWSAEETGGRDITQYMIEYAPVPNEDESEPIPTRMSIAHSRFEFPDLKPATSYRVRVRAVNSEGVGDEAEVTIIAPSESARANDGDDSMTYSSSGPSTGAIVGIVIIVLLIIVVLVDVACYYVNQCGLLMCICVNLCGKVPLQAKAKEVMAEEGGAVKATKFEERQEKQPLKDEQQQPVAKDKIETESTPMINVEKRREQRTDTTV